MKTETAQNSSSSILSKMRNFELRAPQNAWWWIVREVLIIRRLKRTKIHHQAFWTAFWGPTFRIFLDDPPGSGGSSRNTFRIFLAVLPGSRSTSRNQRNFKLRAQQNAWWWILREVLRIRRLKRTKIQHQAFWTTFWAPTAEVFLDVLPDPGSTSRNMRKVFLYDPPDPGGS